MSKHLGDSLIPKIVERMNQYGKSIIVFSTVDEEGTPNSAPMSFVHAANGGVVRVAVYKPCQTLKNIKATEIVSLSFLAGGNIALSARGSCRVVKETMDSSPEFSMVEIVINSVKSDRSMFVAIDRVSLKPIKPERPDLINGIYRELERGC